MKMNTARFVSWLILDGWTAYRHPSHPTGDGGFFDKPGHRVHGYYLGGNYRHMYQEYEPTALVLSGFNVVPWGQVSMKELASLRRTMRKEGLL